MYKYIAQIHTIVGGSPVKVIIYANTEVQARGIIELRPEFDSFYKRPKRM